MRQILIYSLLIISLLNGYKSEEINKEVTINGITFLYGKINREGLSTGEYGKWFNLIHQRYQFDENILETLKKDQLDRLSFKLFMGTWCGDSKRNVPVFYKFLDELNISEDKVESWALDLRKKGPEQEEAKYHIQRVPTIIFYRGGNEIGRFIERPLLGKKLEQLWIEIINKD